MKFNEMMINNILSFFKNPYIGEKNFQMPKINKDPKEIKLLEEIINDDGYLFSNLIEKNRKREILNSLENIVQKWIENIAKEKNMVFNLFYLK